MYNTKEQDSALRFALRSIITKEPLSIRSAVSKEALKHKNISHFFHDLLYFGCQPEMVSTILYYADTHNFFDSNTQEFENNEDDESLPLHFEYSSQNSLAWTLFETTAMQIASELEIDC